MSNVAALNALVTDVMFAPPAERIVRTPDIDFGKMIVLAGTLFPDGLSRVIVHPDKHVSLFMLDRALGT